METERSARGFTDGEARSLWLVGTRNRNGKRRRRNKKPADCTAGAVAAPERVGSSANERCPGSLRAGATCRPLCFLSV